MLTRAPLFCISALLSLMSGSAMADSLALDFTSGTVPTGNVIFISETVGWTFTVTSTVTVTALGVWDEGADGLVADHQVGIWNSSGTLLVSATVSNGTASAVASSSSDGDWRFESTLLDSSAGSNVLGPGTYTIGGLYVAGMSNDLVRSHATSTTASGIAFGDAAESGGGTLQEPVTIISSADAGGFGPNFLIASPSSVPEPATWALMIAAFAGLGCAARRHAVPA
jgi:hypothetical protein